MSGLIQSKPNDFGTVGTTQTISFSAAVTPGSTLALILRWGSTANAIANTGVSDNVNGQWTQSISQVDTGDNILYLYVFENTASGTPTVSIALPATATLRGFLMEIGPIDSGVLSASIDTSNSTDNTPATTTPTSSSITTTHPADYIFAAFGTANGGTYTPGSGWSNVANVATGKLLVDEMDVTTTNTYSDVALGPSDTSSALIVAFKAAGAAAKVPYTQTPILAPILAA